VSETTTSTKKTQGPRRSISERMEEVREAGRRRLAKLEDRRERLLVDLTAIEVAIAEARADVFGGGEADE
jgi:hypothetical protein